jgi:DNA helicase HerA-like ATPase
VARLIRSKGVGIYFITQNPADVPEDILGQLGNRVQHALRAFTAKDQKDLKRAAENYRPNPRFDTEDAIKEVGTGEAVTSFLQNKGVPGIVERTLVRPPQSRLGPLSPEERRAIVQSSPFGLKYDKTIDRESAFEILGARAAAAAQEAAEAEAREAAEAASAKEEAARAREFKQARRFDPVKPEKSASSTRRKSASRSDSIIETFGKSLARQLGSKAGQQLVRGVLGSLFKSR